MQMENDPEFEYDFSDDLVLDDAMEKLCDLRQAAYDNPLSAGTTFAFTPSQVAPHLHGRPLPPFVDRLPETGHSYSVVLQEALYQGRSYNRWGQVWLARVVDSAATAGDRVLGQVVVKVVQPSLLILPEAYMDYIPPKKVAYTEDWMYRRLQSLQGSEIPYYFGIQTVETPCGESAWMLTMEYIQGHTVAQYLDTLHDNSDPDHMPVPTDVKPETFDKLKEVFISSLQGVNAIHAQGVLHGDVRPRNMIISTAFPAGPLVVYVDLAQGEEDVGHARYIDHEEFGATVGAMLCCEAHSDPIQNWGKSGPLPNGLTYPKLG
ncbi:hypothetical protein PLICRDRAFT_32573 [Plicaturopsis crispa FD-325 SS-3]|uniref:Protein kinase domain-containing protein n=1 Tax=Plicaturopsis crispa FD-325 SS-3 TaxID=944288 RepID=A0A0C9T4F4_PLICR|nr:hypothetical protein PLICRDRAFT_32573 [Plicaturopsis crispa FD-325 SS-3]